MADLFFRMPVQVVPLATDPSTFFSAWTSPEAIFSTTLSARASPATHLWAYLWPVSDTHSETCLFGNLWSTFQCSAILGFCLAGIVAFYRQAVAWSVGRSAGRSDASHGWPVVWTVCRIDSRTVGRSVGWKPRPCREKCSSTTRLAFQENTMTEQGLPSQCGPRRTMWPPSWSSVSRRTSRSWGKLHLMFNSVFPRRVRLEAFESLAGENSTHASQPQRHVPEESIRSW